MNILSKLMEAISFLLKCLRCTKKSDDFLKKVELHFQTAKSLAHVKLDIK